MRVLVGKTQPSTETNWPLIGLILASNCGFEDVEVLCNALSGSCVAKQGVETININLLITSRRLKERSIKYVLISLAKDSS